jgi:hypothetical protein
MAISFLIFVPYRFPPGKRKDCHAKEPVYLPFWEKGIKYFNVLGPDGERVEFAERLN